MKLLTLPLILLSMCFIKSTNPLNDLSEDNTQRYTRPVFYIHANFQGASLSMNCTEFELRNVNWHDKISSLYIPRNQGWRVVLYQDSHFNDEHPKARVYSTTSSIVNFDKIRFNDQVSSVKIYKHGVLQGDCIWQ